MGNIIIGFMSGVVVTLCCFVFTDMFKDYKEYKKYK